MSIELNIDGLVGPTHNYAGLSAGNLASALSKGRRSNPKAAALQGLSKMRTLISMGITQAVMPPQERPFIPALRRLGFNGNARATLESAWKTDPALVRTISSASSMWVANAATISPGADCADSKLHVTPANLLSMPHRSIESNSTARTLQILFRDETKFTVHNPLPSNPLFSDEGAANHNRLAVNHGESGLEIFVHGRAGLSRVCAQTKLPARQTLEASEAIARLHGLRPERTLHLRQSARAIDAGAFHNDVVCVSNGPVFLFHEYAFDNPEAIKAEVSRRALPLGFEPEFIMARAQDMPLEDAIKSYFFNSQLVTKPDGKMALILPVEAREMPSACAFAQSCAAGANPINEIVYMDLRQSMRNGGGPACLRLRVALSEAELTAMHQGVLLDNEKITQLERWVEGHYRDYLDPEDLGDPALMDESQTALDALTKILSLGNLYDFQREGA